MIENGVKLRLVRREFGNGKGKIFSATFKMSNYEQVSLTSDFQISTSSLFNWY